MMSARPTISTAKGCLERVVAMRESAERLHNQGDEWFAVCYFYAAYHLLRAAMIEDPIFESPALLAQRSPHLVADDRFATRHNGYVTSGSRVLGINDIVRVLYPSVSVEYRRLHSASIDVRYGEGLAGISPESVADDYEHIVSEYRALKLKA